MRAIRNLVLVPMLSGLAAAQAAGGATPGRNPTAQSPTAQSPTAQSPTAQSPTAQSPTSVKDVQANAVEQAVTDLRQGLLTGRTLRSHVRVTVRLLNGNKLRGIVKDGKLVDLDGNLRFAPGQVRDASDGIKLWYAEGRNSYVVLPFVDIKDYLVQERLTSEQLRVIEQQVAAAEKAVGEDAADKKATEDGAAAPKEGEANEKPPGEAGPAPGQPEGPPGAEKTGAEKTGAEKTGAAAKPAEGGAAAADEQKRMFALVQEFPPSAGWSAKKRDEIKGRLAVVGAKPSKAEERFCEVFAEWEKACKAFGVNSSPPPAPPAEAGAEEEEPTERRRKKRE